MSTYYHGKAVSLEELIHFLSTLESEKPIVSNGLKEAAKEYAKTTFKKPYSDNPDEEVTIVEPDKYAGFIAGTEWQKEQDTREMIMSNESYFQKCYELGKKDMKKQMMSEAVEAKVIESFKPVTTIGEPTMRGCTIIYKDENKPYLVAGDKPRIIIVKEDNHD